MPATIVVAIATSSATPTASPKQPVKRTVAGMEQRHAPPTLALPTTAMPQVKCGRTNTSLKERDTILINMYLYAIIYLLIPRTFSSW